MKRMMTWLMLLAILLLPCAALGGQERPFLMEPPQEVLDHIARGFPAYTLEDYCEIYGTPDGDYGFALLTAGDERMLVGYEEKGGRMSYWLKNHGAVPQGGAYAWFESRAKGEESEGIDHQRSVSDGLSFTVFVTDGESYRKYTSYHWEDGSFKLTGYRDWDVFYGDVNVREGELHFVNWLEEWDFGSARGEIQRELRYVSYNALPKTIEEAKGEITFAPDLPSGALSSTPIRFEGGRNYPVFTGPGEQYARSGNGKGGVSTNDWIQVFGEYDGWILIQYDISADRYRIGWIEASALPEGAQVKTLGLSLLDEPYTTEADYTCELTDDPLNSKQAVAQIPEGTEMTELIYRAFSGWSYVVVTIDGETMCGFVPSDAPIHG